MASSFSQDCPSFITAHPIAHVTYEGDADRHFVTLEEKCLVGWEEILPMSVTLNSFIQVIP